MDHSLDASLHRHPASRDDVGASAVGRMRRHRWTFDHLWFITTIGLIWMFVSLLPLPPHDLWWHLAAGRAMVEQGTLMRTNEWSYAVPRDAPYVYQSWLSELVLYGIWRVGDIPLLVLTRSVVIVVSFGLVAWHAWRRSDNGKAAVLALMFAVLMSWDNWSLRPQTLALLPGAAFVVVLDAYVTRRMGARWLAVLPLVMLAWVNLHGSFVLGGGLLLLTWIGLVFGATRATNRRDDWKRAGALTVAGIATLAAMLANPLGVGIFGYVQALFDNTTVQTRIIEWQPPTPAVSFTNPGFWFFLAVLGLAALMARAPRRPSAAELCWYCGMGWLAFGGVRHVMWFALAMVPLIAAQFASFRRDRRPTPWNARAAALHCAMVGLVGIAMLPWFMPSRYLGPGSAHLYANAGPYPRLLSNTTPVAATTWLLQHPIAGRLWSDMSYSNYVVWRMPDQQIFVDSRIELYPETVWKDNFTIGAGDADSLAALDRWNITHIMARIDVQDDLRALLRATPGWCEPYHDAETVIIARCSALP